MDSLLSYETAALSYETAATLIAVACFVAFAFAGCLIGR